MPSSFGEPDIAIVLIAMYINHDAQQGGDLHGISQVTFVGASMRPQTRDAPCDLVWVRQGVQPPDTCRNGNNLVGKGFGHPF